METPSSLKNISRSQATAKSHTTKKVDSVSRFALSELTGNSPIIGVAMSRLPEKTPKTSAPVKNISGSGESLLRGQVKASKWKQELKEEGEFFGNKVSTEESTVAPTPAKAWFQELKGEVVFVENKVPTEEPVWREGVEFFRNKAPRDASRVAPTPANTSQIFMASLINKKEPIKILDPVVPEQPLKIQEEFVINRALLFDSPDKTELTEKTSLVSSTLSYQDSDNEEKVEEEVEEEEEEEEEYEDAEGCNDESIDDMCAGLSKITVQEKKVELPEFEGKHTRFVYNSDGEIESEELIVCDKVVSPSAVVLKGLPVPEGKHLRFHEEEEDDDDRYLVSPNESL